MDESVHVVCPECSATNRVPAERLGDGAVCGRCKRPLFSGHPVTLDRFNFQQQLQNGDLPVVVDFWAPWCGPCLSFAPVFERAAAELEPKVRLAKLDTQAEQGLAANYGIRSIPTLAIFRHGRELARQAGATDLTSFLRWVRTHTG